MSDDVGSYPELTKWIVTYRGVGGYDAAVNVVAVDEPTARKQANSVLKGKKIIRVTKSDDQHFMHRPLY